MIRLVRGLPGNGKGLYLIKTIIRRLRSTDRFIVTNLPVELGELNAHMQERYPEEWDGQDIHRRVHILKPMDVFRFYSFRSPEHRLKEDSDQKIREGLIDKKARLDQPAMIKEWLEIYGVIDTWPAWARCGVDYLIDEAHNYFDAREWAATGRGLSYYNSQHRHLMDQVWFASQFPDQVEGRVIKLCQECVDLRNQSMERLGPFKKRPGFSVKHYYKVPKSLPNTPPMYTEFWGIDLAEAVCYKTTGALGTGDGGAEEGSEPVRGLPWWSLWAGALGLALVVGGLLLLAPRMVGGAIGYVVSGTTSGLTSQVVPEGPGERSPAARDSAEARAAAWPAGRSEMGSGGQVWLRSYSVIRIGGRETVRVMLSDGRVYSESDPEIEGLDEDRVRIGGRWYYREPVSTERIHERG